MNLFQYFGAKIPSYKEFINNKKLKAEIHHYIQNYINLSRRNKAHIRVEIYYFILEQATSYLYCWSRQVSPNQPFQFSVSFLHNKPIYQQYKIIATLLPKHIVGFS